MSYLCGQDQCIAGGLIPKSEFLEQIELAIRGMTCDACASHVAAALQSVDGVVAAEVPDWKSGRALVTVTAPDRVPEETLIRAVSSAGYQASRNSSHAASTTKHPGPAPS